VRRQLLAAAVRSVLGVAVLVIAYYVVPIEAEEPLAITVRAIAGGAVSALVLGWQIRAINRSEVPRLRAAEALAVTVTLMVVMFASLYLTVSARDPSAFSERLGRTGALYYTLTILTTVGFGDIAARTDGARIAVIAQMVFNVVAIGLAVRLIVASAQRRTRERS
jgi:hypothetical protein